MRALALVFTASALWSQDGQQGPRPEWPCVAGRAVDPAYLEISESTGGQIFLLQKSEIGRAGLFLTGDLTHPATIVRAVGMLSGTREFQFPIDSSVKSVLLLASIQCRTAIGIMRPSGTEMTAANSTQSIDLQAGRAVKVDNPEPGQWKVRLQGTGLFVLSVRADSPVSIGGIEFQNAADVEASNRQPLLAVNQKMTIHMAGELSSAHFQMLAPTGEVLGDCADPVSTGGAYQCSLTPSTERFRIRMTAADASGWPVERVYPVLFRAIPAGGQK